MNFRDILFYDYETTGKNPHTCQPIELAAVIIDGRKLEVREDSCFSSYIKPMPDEEAIKYGMEPVTPEVLGITKIDPKNLETAPSLKTVWSQFELYTKKYNPGKDSWTAPIGVGFNVDGYDNIINTRIAGGHYWQINAMGYMKELGLKEPWGFGPWDEKRLQHKLFHPIFHIDLMDTVWQWTENMKEMDRISMDRIRQWLGIDAEHAHRGIVDVVQGAYIFARFLRLTRAMVPKVKFANSFTVEDNKAIARLVNGYL